MATIRLATEEDAAAIAAIYAPYCETSAISFEMVAPSPEEMARRIRAIGAIRPWLVLENTDAATLAGYAYASPHHERAAYQWSVSTAIYVNSAQQRRGVGRALYTTLFEVLRLLGYFRATAGITLPNPASVGLHEAFGFTKVGVYRHIGHKLGAWHDVAWFEAEVQPVTENPAPPRSMTSLTEGADWRAAVAKGLACYVEHP
jgi:L-amino acid N-acyltransferase YncA